MVDAIPALVTEKSIRMFERFGVFSESELFSRAEIKYETYNKALNIEALTMIDMAVKQILPAVIKYTGTLSQIIESLRAIGADASVQTELLSGISSLRNEANGALKMLRAATTAARTRESNAQRGHSHHV